MLNCLLLIVIAVDSDAFDASGEEETENKQVDSVEQDASSGEAGRMSYFIALALGMLPHLCICDAINNNLKG